MEAYDAARDYWMALGPKYGRSRARPTPGGAGMSPVILSTRLMFAIDTGRQSRDREPSHDERTAPGLRAQDAAAAA